MGSMPSRGALSNACARLALLCWVAAALLARSSFAPATTLLEVLAGGGLLLFVLGFYFWRRTMVRPDDVQPLRSQLVAFARPLVGMTILIVSAILAGATLAADDVSLVYLGLATLFAMVGLGLSRERLVANPGPYRKPQDRRPMK